VADSIVGAAVSIVGAAVSIVGAAVSIDGVADSFVGNRGCLTCCTTWLTFMGSGSGFGSGCGSNFTPLKRSMTSRRRIPAILYIYHSL